MAHQSIKLIPGVNVEETYALNQAGVSASQLIRYKYDPQLGGILEKLGGWTKFYSNTTPAVTRALWAWEDTENASHLAYGTQTGGSGAAQLAVITNGTLADITPRTSTANVAAAASATIGNNIVTLTDASTPGITQYDAVFITVPIAVGGIVLFGFYACDPDGFAGATTYTVAAADVLGNPQPAKTTSAVPVLPLLATTSAKASVQVTLPNHGYTTASQFPILVSTTVGGSTFVGHFPVQSVIDANNFTITATTTPTATTSGYINSNQARYIYTYGVGAAPAGTGYGIGGYGRGGYGSGLATTPAFGSAVTATDWILDNWGRVLIAVAIRASVFPQFQPIYVWDAEGGAPWATALPQGPTVSDGVFVAMPQRQLVAWGTSFDGIQDQLLIRWCDVGNYNAWVGNVTNQAGSYRLPRGSRIVGALQGSQQAFIWTDLGVWSMQYVGQPYVYSFTQLGDGCGLAGRKAANDFDDGVYWMGPSQFFVLDGDGVRPLACTVWDVVFQNIDFANADKIRCTTNSLFNEISWYYPTLTSGGEVSAYVTYNSQVKAWTYGTLARTAWADQSVLGSPIGADPSTLYLYQHETSPDADGQALLASFQSGYAAMSEGDQMMFVDQVWPDMRWGYYGQAQSATVAITFYVTDYPGIAPKVFGPYNVNQATQFISPRFRGRLISIKVSSSDTGTFWRMGNIRYRATPDGSF